MNNQSPVPDFEVLSDATDSGTLLCGFSELGPAGPAAVEYLLEQLELAEVGSPSGPCSGCPHRERALTARRLSSCASLRR